MVLEAAVPLRIQNTTRSAVTISIKCPPASLGDALLSRIVEIANSSAWIHESGSVRAGLAGCCYSSACQSVRIELLFRVMIARMKGLRNALSISAGLQR